MTRKFREAARCETGATAIEYSMIAGMIAFVIIAAVALIGSGVKDFLLALVGVV